jgi:hypothetical protein
MTNFQLGALLGIPSCLAFLAFPHLRGLFAVSWAAGMLLMLLSIERHDEH